jgi:hypothetical protein
MSDGCVMQGLTGAAGDVQQQQLYLSALAYGELENKHKNLLAEHTKLKQERAQYLSLLQGHPHLLKAHYTITQPPTGNHPHPSSNDPGNFTTATTGRTRDQKSELQANYLWKFAEEYFGGKAMHAYPHGHEDEDANGEGKRTTMLTGVEYEVIDYITKKQRGKLVDVLLTHKVFRNKIAEYQRKAARAHEKTEEHQSLSCAVASQVKLGTRKWSALHSRLFRKRDKNGEYTYRC